MYRDEDHQNISKQELSQLFKTFIQNDKNFLAKHNNLSTIRKSPKRDRSQSNNRGSPQPRGSPMSRPKSDPNMNQTFSRPKPSFINRSQVLTQLSRIMNKKYENSDEFRYIIKKIFEFYASFADRLNTEILKLANLYKFADNASLLSKEITHRTFDSLFYKHCQKQASINFEQFLLLLVDVSVLKYPNLDHKDAFTELFNSHLKGLYKTIFKDTDFGEYETILREPVYEETFAVLRIISPMMAKLHSHYFRYEYQKLDSIEVENKCEGCAKTFLKDFEICPQLISFGLAHTVLRELLNSDSNQLFDIVGEILGLEYDVGVEFTLSKFLIFLLRIAMIWGFQHYQGRFFGENAEISQQDVLIMLLEKMEISKGCMEFKEDCSTQKFSLLPKKLYEHKRAETAYSSYVGGSGLPSQTRGRRKLSGNSSDFLPLASMEDCVLHQSKRRNYGNENRKTPSPLKWAKASLGTSRVINVFEKNKESLNALFRKYCVVALGENETSRTRAFGIVKLFKQARLMKGIGNQEEMRVQGNILDDDEVNPQARLIKHMELDLFLRELTSQNLLRANNLKILSQNQNQDEENISINNKDPKDRCDSFLDFLKSIQYVSSHVYPQFELDVAISYVIENHLFPLLKEKKLPSEEIELRGQVKKIVNLLSEPELVDVLGKLKKCLGYFYKAYSKSDGKMNVEDFVHFNRTFKVIPDIVSKAKLMDVLGTLFFLSERLAQSEKTGTKRSKSPLDINKRRTGLIIDENLFVEALALIAARLETNLAGGILDKLIFVLEKIKEGCYLSANERILAPTELKKSKKEIQELINYTKSRYLNIIQSGLTNVNKHHVNNKTKMNFENFDEIFIVNK